MLKCIHPLLSADLVKVLMDMGHCDEIVFADRNFAAVTHARRLVGYPGVSIVPLLEAVLEQFPIDYAVAQPAVMMRIPPNVECDDAIQQTYARMLTAANGAPVGIEYLDRYEFYDRVDRAFAVVATGETARFANLILRKGIVRD